MKIMQAAAIFFYTLSLLFISNFSKSQEIVLKGASKWTYNNTINSGYSVELDSITKFENTTTLAVTGSAGSDNSFLPFSKLVSLTTEVAKVIRISAYLKTANLKRGAALWCQIRDAKNKQVGFMNTEMQGVKVLPNSDWKLYSMTLLLDTDVKNLILGGYLMGEGKMWVGDFRIEEVKNTPTDGSSLMSYITQVNKLIKDHSIYKDSLNWSAIDKDLNYLKTSLDTSNIDAVNQYYTKVLRQAGDIHSFFQNKQMSKAYSTKNTNPNRPNAKILANDIAYISVPGFGSTDNKTVNIFADTIQNLIKKMDDSREEGIKKWIVDLSGNTGGNMYPMIAGLGPLIGEGDLGYFVGKKSYPWTYKKGKSGSAVVTKPYNLKNIDIKIVVILGKSTASSGEMTAISFIGKPNVKTFGEPTAGYITANSSYPLVNGGMLLLASSYVADRNHKKYTSKIIPEQPLFKPVENDLVNKQILDWFAK